MLKRLKSIDLNVLYTYAFGALILLGPFIIPLLISGLTEEPQESLVTKQGPSEEERYQEDVQRYSKNIADLRVVSELLYTKAIPIFVRRDAKCLSYESLPININHEENPILEKFITEKKALCDSYTFASNVIDNEVQEILKAIDEKVRLPLWEYGVYRYEELNTEGLFTTHEQCARVVEALHFAGQEVVQCRRYDPVIYDVYWPIAS